MPGSSTNALGNVLGAYLLYANLTPPATVTTNSSTTSTYTVNGLLIGDAIDIYPQSTLAAQYLNNDVFPMFSMFFIVIY